MSVLLLSFRNPRSSAAAASDVDRPAAERDLAAADRELGEALTLAVLRAEGVAAPGPGACCSSGALLGALLDRSSELHDVELIHLHVNGDVAKAASAAAPNIRRCALFVDSSTRDAVATGAATYLPVFLSDVPRLFSTGRLPLDVALLHVSPPDAHGYCSLGVSVDCTLAAARAAPRGRGRDRLPCKR